MTQTWGIDLSNHNAGANIAHAHAAGAAFVFAKATEGLTYTDPLFAGFRRDAHAAGVPFGAYHFAKPQPGRLAADEARHFLATIGHVQPGELPPVLDLEWTTLDRADTAAWALQWLRTVQAVTGMRPLLYVSPGFLSSHVGAASGLGAFPLWLADYTTKTPTAPHPWAWWEFWQQTSGASVPGVPGRCDRSVTTLTPAGVRALCKPSPLPVPAHVPTPARHPITPAPAPAHRPTPPTHAPAVTTKAGGTVLGARTLGPGDRGEDVRFVQRFLGITQDGEFGPKTKTAVEDYQHMRHLGVSGWVGHTTWASMLTAVKAH